MPSLPRAFREYPRATSKYVIMSTGFLPRAFREYPRADCDYIRISSAILTVGLQRMPTASKSCIIVNLLQGYYRAKAFPKVVFFSGCIRVGSESEGCLRPKTRVCTPERIGSCLIDLPITGLQ